MELGARGLWVFCDLAPSACNNVPSFSLSLSSVVPYVSGSTGQAVAGQAPRLPRKGKVALGLRHGWTCVCLRGVLVV